MPRNDLTGHLYRQRKAGVPQPATKAQEEVRHSAFAFDAFTFFVGCLLTASLLSQFALMFLRI